MGTSEVFTLKSRDRNPYALPITCRRSIIEWEERKDPIYFFRSLAEREALKRAIVKLSKQ